MVDIPPGRYLATIETYDATGGGGNVLSAAQNVPFTALAGKANTVQLTLSGIPHELIATGTTSLVRSAASQARGRRAHGESPGSALKIYGASPQPLTVVAEDADDNAIVGLGAPTISASIQPASGWALATPGPQQSPDVFHVTPPDKNGSATTLQLDASFGDSTCALATAVCQTYFSVSNDVQTLFVSDSSTDKVSVYTPVSASQPTATISNGLTSPTALGVDVNQNVYVLDAGSNVLEYAPPYNGSPEKPISVSAAEFPMTIAVSSDGHIAVADFFGPEPTNIWVYSPPYSSPPVKISSTGHPEGLLFDSQGDLFISSCGAECGGPPGFTIPLWNTRRPLADGPQRRSPPA